jgi:hypothetical protein
MEASLRPTTGTYFNKFLKLPQYIGPRREEPNDLQ